ncbi:MAG TPA: hypothetical protein VG015_02140, partial [Candidatus Dormibacteraeota bacterium]|nr:hypothetical protein [Candidatus Dormibacteraeota bacterium]
MTNSLVGANSKPQGTAFLSLDRGLQTVVMAVPTAALALLSVLILKGAAGPSAGQILILLVAAILALVADLRPVQIAPHRNTSFSSVPILIAVLLLPPLMSATMAGLSTLAANTVLRRPWYNSLYNAGLTVVASVAAAAIAQPPIGPTGPS